MSKYKKESNTLITSCCLEELPKTTAKSLVLKGKGTPGKTMGEGRQHRNSGSSRLRVEDCLIQQTPCPPTIAASWVPWGDLNSGTP